MAKNDAPLTVNTSNTKLKQCSALCKHCFSFVIDVFTVEGASFLPFYTIAMSFLFSRLEEKLNNI